MTAAEASIAQIINAVPIALDRIAAPPNSKKGRVASGGNDRTRPFGDQQSIAEFRSALIAPLSSRRPQPHAPKS